MVVAGPGTGKSALVLTYVIKSGVPALYFSPDSNSFTQVQRAYSVATGEDMSEAELFARGKMDNNLDLLSKLPIRFNFSAAPTLDEIERSVAAFEEVYGEFPAIVVVDNITNVRSGIQDNDQDPFSGLEGLLEYLNTLARDTNACVIGLHHANGPYNDADRPIPLSGVKGQVGRVPSMILTMFRAGPGMLGVSPVKNRGSEADPSGERYAELVFDGDTMTIADVDQDSGSAFPVPVVESVQDVTENEGLGF